MQAYYCHYYNCYCDCDIGANTKTKKKATVQAWFRNLDI